MSEYTAAVDQLDIDIVTMAVRAKKSDGVKLMNVRYETLAAMGGLDSLASQQADKDRYDRTQDRVKKNMFAVADVKKLHKILFGE